MDLPICIELDTIEEERAICSAFIAYLHTYSSRSRKATLARILAPDGKGEEGSRLGAVRMSRRGDKTGIIRHHGTGMLTSSHPGEVAKRVRILQSKFWGIASLSATSHSCFQPVSAV